MSNDIEVALQDYEEIAVEVGLQGFTGPPGTPTPTVRVEIGAGSEVIDLLTPAFFITIKSVELRIEVPYNDPLAKLSVGTTDYPELAMSIKENKLQGTGKYVVDYDTEINAGTTIKLFLNSKATVGKGVLTLCYIVN